MCYETPQVIQKLYFRLLEKQNEEYLRLYSDYAFLGKSPDVKAEDMKKSKSKSKFACYACHRSSFRLNLSPEIVSQFEALESSE